MTQKPDLLGNYFDKYGSKNPIVRYLLRNFSLSLFDLIHLAGPNTIHDVGCGEGHWALKLAQLGYTVKGSDLSSSVFQESQDMAKELFLNKLVFQERSIYDLSSTDDTADLLLCLEILEHIDEPRRALLKLQDIVSKSVIFSVPNEPLWRVLNIARGSYLSDFGNTPGHIQHWSTKRFVQLVSEYFEVVEIRRPLPWTMLLCRPRK